MLRLLLLLLTLVLFNQLIAQCGLDLDIEVVADNSCAPCDYDGPEVLLNVVAICPPVGNGALIGKTVNDLGEGEWIELFNPSPCSSIDISHYIIGSYAKGAGTAPNGDPVLDSDGMAFSIPQGTIVPPLGYVIIRGPDAPVPNSNAIDINIADYTDYVCIEGGDLTETRFWLSDGGAYLMLYHGTTGEVLDGISWGGGALNSLVGERPCIPNQNSLDPSVTQLSSYTEAYGSIQFPPDGNYLGQGECIVYRTPDGAAWNEPVWPVPPWQSIQDQVYGVCNDPNNCPEPSCFGSITLTVTSGSSPYTYQWSHDDLLNSNEATNLCAGTYEIIITSNDGCEELVVIELEGNAFEWQFDIQEVTCTFQDGEISVLLDSPEDYTYTWSENAGVVGNYPTASGLNPGTYSLTVSDGVCEQDTVIVLQEPECDELCDITYSIVENCLSGTVDVTIDGGQTADESSLFNAQNLLPATASFVNTSTNHEGTISLENLEDGDNFSFEVVDENDCLLLIEGIFTGTEDASFHYLIDEICLSDNNPTPVITGLQGGSFSSNNPNISINPTTGEINLAESTEGTYDITYTTSENVCSSSSVFSITLHPVPTFAVTAENITTCNGQDGSISLVNLSANSNYTITYSYDGQTIEINDVISDNFGEFVIDNLAAGVYSSITVTNEFGCSQTSQTSSELTEPEGPTVGAGPNQEVCLFDTVTLTAINPDGASINWDQGVEDGISFSAPTPGLFNYTVTVTIDGCSSSAVVSVLVHDLPTVIAGDDQVVCATNETVVVAQGANEYNWNNEVENNVPFIPQLSGYYTVIGIDQNGCSNSDSLYITIEEPLAITITSDPHSGCAPLDVDLSFQVSDTNQETTCTLLFDDELYEGCGTFNFWLESSGCYDLLYTVTSENGCISELFIPDYICVYPNPVAAFEASPSTITTDNTHVDFINLSENATTYVWDFGDGSNLSEEQAPSHTYTSNSNTYEITLIAISENGCVDIITQQITQSDELIYYVPNAFTPDGDQYNQTFKPIFTSGFDKDSYSLEIYNRWGEMLFSTDNFEKGWDGKNSLNDKVVKDGVYVWRISFRELNSIKTNVINGHVTLIR